MTPSRRALWSAALSLAAAAAGCGQPFVDTQYAEGGSAAGPLPTAMNTDGLTCGPSETSPATLTAHASPEVTRWQRFVVATATWTLTIDDYRTPGTFDPAAPVELLAATVSGCVVCAQATLRGAPAKIRGGMARLQRASAASPGVAVSLQALVLEPTTPGGNSFCLQGPVASTGAPRPFTCAMLSVPTDAQGCYANPNTLENRAVSCNALGATLVRDCVPDNGGGGAAHTCRVTPGGTANCSES